MRVTILGKYWSFVRGRCPPDTLGLCCPTTRTLTVKPSLRGQRELDTIIHEAMHAGDWHKTEEWVDQFSTDLAKLLWKLGYRKE